MSRSYAPRSRPSAADFPRTAQPTPRHARLGPLAAATAASPSGRRDPRPGERCSCGLDAVVVFITDLYGEVPSCRR